MERSRASSKGQSRALADAKGVVHQADPQFLELVAGDWPRCSGVTASPAALPDAVVAGIPAVDRKILDEPDVRAAYSEACALTLTQGAGALLRDFELAAREWPF